MLRAPAAAAIGLILSLAASAAMAIGFGRYGNSTTLGQPLDFSAVVTLGVGDGLTTDCVNVAVTAGERKIFRDHVYVHLDSSGREGQTTLRVRTSVRIYEPVVIVELTLDCTAQLSRQFVVFLDPSSSGASSTRAEGSTTAFAGESRAASIQKAGSKPIYMAQRHVAPAMGSRLMLEPTQQFSSADLQAASAPTARGEVTEHDMLVRERGRLVQLEQSLERLREENAESRKSLAALQTRLRERESQSARATNQVLYGLSSLVVLLLMAVAVLLWRQQRMRREPAWWGSALQAREWVSAQSAPEEADQIWEREHVSKRRSQEIAPLHAGEPVQPTVAERELAAESMPIKPEALVSRELSADELIDLEQQADFFVVLGQDEAAIDLLMAHVRSSGGSSPMPYLKLLEIYRRRGERDAYERIRERFNRRFNAYASDWEADSRAERTLETYLDVMRRLQAVWPEPGKATALLEALLFQRTSSDQVFDLPAFGELLFLYSHARDLAEHDAARNGVDLLLPLVKSPAPVPQAAVLEPLRPAKQDAAALAVPADLGLDLNLDAPEGRL